jgi:hypothetical protein
VKTEILLSRDEAIAAATRGITRRLGPGWVKHRTSHTADAWARFVLNALAEEAVRRITGWPWPESVEAFETVEGAGPIVARWAVDGIAVANGELSEARCIVVTGDAPAFAMAGWIILRDAERVGDLWAATSTSGERWWVPTSRLRPIKELLGVVAEEVKQMPGITPPKETKRRKAIVTDASRAISGEGWGGEPTW